MTSGADPVKLLSQVEVLGGQGVEIDDRNKQVNLFIQTYIDDRRLLAGPLIRSGYLEQVRRIAPPQLYDRNDELAELAAFCTEPGQGPYVWWRAPAWAGKSALMSWFVLHPPPGVQVVSFFVTARYKGQDNRAAFIDAVMEQLADLLGEPIPAYLTETNREFHLLRMLSLAAEKFQRLVLVVDGLDEDRGVTIGPDAYSIAALLPARPPAGLRVIVASRPGPPVPEDVPDDHPLRDPGIVRVLAASRSAQVVRTDMQRELKRLLVGSQAERDLLGMVATAGGGLSAGDLAELTSLPLYEIEESLHAVAGRTFAAHASRWQPRTAPPVYVLGHEELQAAAAASLGPVRLKDYRDRLHAWAEDYRRRGWPIGTPEYLLRGYFRMLLSGADIPRLLDYATDQLRHDRMLDITGGDTAALTEITDLQDLLLHQEEPDLTALARLNVHRTLIAERNAHVPVTLPGVWTAIGYPERAEALAWAIPGTDRQARALGNLAQAVADAGDVDRARELAGRAIAAARTIPDPDRRAGVLTDLARLVAGTGDVGRATELADRAETAARAITNRGRQAQALAALAQAVAYAGDLDRAEAVAQAIRDPGRRAGVLTDLARLVAGTGDVGRATELADRAETAARAITNRGRQAQALAALAQAAAYAGDPDRAEAAARAITNRGRQAQALAALAQAAAYAGDPDRAEAAARAITNRGRRAQALAALAQAAAYAGDLDRARELASQAETAALAITNRGRQAQVLADLAQVAAGAGDVDRARELAERAETTARAASDPGWQAQALAILVRAVAAAGDVDLARELAQRAEAAARAISDPARQAQALAILVRAVVGAGDVDLGRELAERAEAAAGAISDPARQAQALTILVRAAADAGDLDRARELADRAETIAGAISDPARQAQVLADLARLVAGAGDVDLARELAERAEAAAGAISDPARQAQALTILVRAAADAGDLDRAETIALAISHAGWQAQVLADLARLVVGAGDVDRARELAERAEATALAISDPGWQAQALVFLVRAVAGAGDVDRARELAERAEATALAISDPGWQAQVLTDLARLVVGVGDVDWARELAERAEAAAGAISDPARQAQALTILVRAAADARDLDWARELANRAEATAQAISDPGCRAQVLTDLARAAAEAGDLDRSRELAERAEATARVISDPDRQAQVLTDLAHAAADAGELDRAETAALAISDPGRQAQTLADLATNTEPGWARSLLAQALTAGHWLMSLNALVQIDPAAVISIANEHLSATPSPREFHSMRIYLSTDHDHKAVEKALEELLDAFDLKIVRRFPGHRGSWFREFLVRSKKNGPITEEALSRIAREVELQAPYMSRAVVDARQIAAVAKLMMALGKEENAAIQIGPLLLVKVNNSCVVRTLSPLQLAYLEKNPGLFQDPAGVLQQLQQAIVEATSPAAFSIQLCACGSGLPAASCCNGGSLAI